MNDFFVENPDAKTEPVETRAVSLNLSGVTGGAYYFNGQNNFDYARNWFNYTQFATVSNETLINEVVQYGQPDLRAANLDPTKRYSVPQTGLSPVWAARVQTGSSTPTPGYSGVDATGNTYLVVNYAAPNNAVVFSAANVSTFTKASNGTNSVCICIAKYNSSGVPQWSARIRTQTTGLQVNAVYAVTDQAGTTYLMGDCTVPVVFENAAGADTLTVSMSDKSFVVAYDTNGTPDWITYFTTSYRGILCVDNLTLGSVYVLASRTSGPTTFFNNVPISPAAVLSVPASEVILAKFRSSSGVFMWATYLTGNRLSVWRNGLTYDRQSICTDASGNLYVTGYYTEITAIYNAASPDVPVFTPSPISLPPYASPLVWVPRENERQWSAVDLTAGDTISGTIAVAAVDGGFLYLSLDAGVNWTPTASEQEWTSVFVSGTGIDFFVIGATRNSVLWRGSQTLTSTLNWTVVGGAGGVTRDWVAVTGMSSGPKVVAAAYNDFLYYSSDSGNTFAAATGTSAQWVAVAVNTTNNLAIALSTNTSPFVSYNAGASWSTAFYEPVRNWSAVCASPGVDNPSYHFFATLANGGIYGIYYDGSLWVFTLLDATPRLYTAIASNETVMFATVRDGAMYQSFTGSETTWTPVTIPRAWNTIAIDARSQTAVASVAGGQLYVATDYLPRRHTFLIQYNPEGVAQWSNYLNNEAPDNGDNFGAVVTCTPRQTVILSGLFITGILKLYRVDNFEIPVKTLSARASPVHDVYVIEFSAQGNPLWANSAGTFGGGADYLYHSATVDANGNIYAVGSDTSAALQFINPNENGATFTGDLRGVVLAKYYSNGALQSITRLCPVSTLAGAMGTSVCVAGALNDVYISGWNSVAQTLNVYASMGTSLSTTEPFTSPGAFVVKFTASTAYPLVWFPPPAYNTTFIPSLSIGGSSRERIDGYPADGPLELWGGRTGLEPSAIQLADANAGVISYLGHEPGYTGGSDDYRYLSVRLTEPTFPSNDPDPVTPSSVPYGFIPIVLTLPATTTRVQLNAALNDTSPLILSCVGSASSTGEVVSGVRVGDYLRLLMHGTARSAYLTVQLKGFIVADSSTGTNAGLLFEEPTVYAASSLGQAEDPILNLTAVSARDPITGDVIPNRFLAALYLPAVINSGTLHVILECTPKQHP